MPAAPKPAYDGYLTPQQVQYLLAPVDPRRVFHAQGMSNMAAYEIRAHLNRLFGFGRWSGDVIEMSLIHDLPVQLRNDRQGVKVAYRAGYRLTVKSPDGTELATYTEYAMGESQMPDFKHGDCHDMAMKTAESQALKRCATNLGDQFGLSLYGQGSTDALVQGTFVGLPERPADKVEHQQVVEETDPDAKTEPQEPAAAPQPASQTPPPPSTHETVPEASESLTAAHVMKAMVTLPPEKQRAVVQWAADEGFPPAPQEFSEEQIALTLGRIELMRMSE